MRKVVWCHTKNSSCVWNYIWTVLYLGNSWLDSIQNWNWGCFTTRDFAQFFFISVQGVCCTTYAQTQHFLYSCKTHTCLLRAGWAVQRTTVCLDFDGSQNNSNKCFFHLLNYYFSSFCFRNSEFHSIISALNIIPKCSHLCVLRSPKEPLQKFLIIERS